jgi:DNA-binding transcriptional MerR regulator
MEKSPDAFRTISEVAEWLGVPTHVLRFWESRFTQVKPVKRAGGRRYYRPRDMELLGGIQKLLHEDGMTIRGVQKVLREEGVRYVAGFSPPLVGREMAAGDVIELNATQAPAAPPQKTGQEPAAGDLVPEQEAPMAVDVPVEDPENVHALDADSTPASEPEPERGPRGDILEPIQDELPMTGFRATIDAGREKTAPRMGAVIPDDPSDDEETKVEFSTLAAALRRVSRLAPAVEKPPADKLIDVYNRLQSLRARMDDAPPAPKQID